MRFCASRTVTFQRALVSLYAAARPESPAPITMQVFLSIGTTFVSGRPLLGRSMPSQTEMPLLLKCRQEAYASGADSDGLRCPRLPTEPVVVRVIATLRKTRTPTFLVPQILVAKSRKCECMSS